MKTKSERFVESRKDDWRALKDIINKTSRKGVKRLSNKELEQLPVLYRKVCQDLAQARMLKLSPDVLEYLNSLTAKSNEQLYSLKPLTGGEVVTFFTNTLPGIFRATFIYIIISAILFLGTGLITYRTIRSNPKLINKVMDENSVNSIESMHSEIHNEGRNVGENSSMTAFYINHNISIGFLCFATGIFLGLGTLYFLVFNGVYLGAIFAHLHNVGYGYNILHFVTAHSFLELFGIIISGAAGLLLGVTVLRSWKSYKLDILKKYKSRILTLMTAAFFLIGSAAFVEAFISPSTLSYSIRLITLITSIFMTLGYYVIYPGLKRSKLNVLQ